MKERTCFECGKELFFEDFLEANVKFNRHLHEDEENLERMFRDISDWQNEHAREEFLMTTWESEDVEFFCCQCYYEWFGRPEG